MRSRRRPGPPRAPLPGGRPGIAWVVAVAALAGSGCRSAAGPPEPAAPPRAAKPDAVPPTAAGAGGKAATRAADASLRTGPVTHLGRTVLSRCHLMFLGTVAGRVSAIRGLEVLRISEDELLWGPELPAEEGPILVAVGEQGVAPATGRRVLVLARLLPSGNFEAVQITTVDDTDGAAKLSAFRRVLEVEALPSWEDRSAALRVTLRTDLASEDKWRRGYAVREYAAFGDAFPGALAAEDLAALSDAEPGITDGELRRLLAAVLSSNRGASPGSGRAPSPSPSSKDAGGKPR